MWENNIVGYDTVDPKTLIPNPLNWRRHPKNQSVGLEGALEEIGWIQDIIVNKRTGKLIDGHLRLELAIKYKQESVPVKYVDISEEKEKLAIISLDPITAMAEADSNILNSLIESCKTENEKIQELLQDIAKKERLPVFKKEATEDDYEPPAEIETDIQRGDIIQLGRHRVMCGDSTNRENVDRLMDGKTAELLFTSPPYSDMRSYQKGTDISIPKLTQFVPAVLNHCNFIVINLGLQFKDSEVVPYWQDYIDVAKENGLKLLAWNVWDKSQAGSIAQATNMFLLTHEWLFVFGTRRKDLNRTVPNNLDEYAKRHGNDFLKGLEGKRIRTKEGGMLTKPSSTYTHHQLHSVLPQTPELSTKRKLHPAMFPVALVAEYILAMTNQDDIIIDPFLGSGTTLIACEQLDRTCYGIEISPQYCEIICQRWEKLTGNTRQKQN